MSLASELSSDFPRAIRSRGSDYYSRGRVKISKGSAWEVLGTVRGGALYQVLLLREADTILGKCSCQFYQTEGACKHLWATILEADEKSYLAGDGRSGPIYFIDDLDEEEVEDYDDYPGKGDEDQDEEEEDEEDEEATPRSTLTLIRPPMAEKKEPNWKEQLAAVGVRGQTDYLQKGSTWPADRQILYIIDVPSTISSQRLYLEILIRDRRQDGEWGKPRKQRIPRWQIAELPDPIDRQIFASLAGSLEQSEYGYYFQSSHDSAPFRYSLISPLPQILVPVIARTGRCGLRLGAVEDEWIGVSWDEGEPWEFWVGIKREGDHYLVEGNFRRGEQEMELPAPIFLLDGGLIFTRESAALLDDGQAFQWLVVLRRTGLLKVPENQIGELMTEILNDANPPRLDLPSELKYEEVTQLPQPCLTLKSPQRSYWSTKRLNGKLSFDYAVGENGGQVNSLDLRRGVYVAEKKKFFLRDLDAENAAKQTLIELGLRIPRSNYQAQEFNWELISSRLPRVVRKLVGLGWLVEAEGQLYRSPGEFNLKVSSGIDWFELHGSVEFGETRASMPELLAALRRGENVVKLDDGTFGMLPEEWLRKYGLIAGLGTVEDDHVRFTRSQVGLLDALLAAQPEARFDEKFDLARRELKSFEGIKPLEPPDGFIGELRPYQKEGLGWMDFLRRFGFGGCLADDMGVGKTIQVLALLESRRGVHQPAPGSKSKNGKGVTRRISPSLVVVPKSLVFNWKQEAARFTPRLRVLDHTGQDRQQAGEHFDDYDLIITTYGTLRRDAVDFKDVQFDYLILDEAQAIKNADTESAKAARLLRGDHRLALSGTPVENHLGELWSLFEFLNPGMLGASSVLKLTGAGARTPDEDTRKLLSQALRPFILRRTKDQVAKDLPAKHEQTLYCELEPKQRKLYDELRDHYRVILLKRIELEGIKKSKIQVLEALLRLRQAACHPGLIDKKRVQESSAKLDMLLPQLSAVIDEGHKVLVFSQFTSMLAILRNHLDKDRVVYEYLDGKTRDRQARVERFQSDPECKLFLISLKAGGLGLNLTAAEYVYLLDPWWNPAVEAQAIDRAHRIGQSQQVFAYRIIARDTVEEKVLELQNTKRDLADAIINADNSLIRSLGREDLEMLLA